MSATPPAPDTASASVRPPLPRRGRATAIAAVVLALVAGLAWSWFARSVDTRPDIVIFMWDTSRADRCSTFGASRPTTPFLDSLAAEGVAYEQCFTPAPWTAPSHGSLFTGLLPRRHGLETVPGRMRRGIPLMAETLRDAGYETAGFTCNVFVSELTGLHAGFEHFVVLGKTGPTAGEAKASGERALEALETFLAGRRERKRKPLFLFVNLMEPHLPRSPSAEDLRAVLGEERAAEPILTEVVKMNQKVAVAFTVGLRALDAEALRHISDVYDASMRAADRVTAAMMARLEASGLAPDSLIAVVGDHGENLGEHRQLDHIVSTYEPVLHVPLVLRRRGEFEGGRREKRQVLLQDLHPTVLETAGVVTPPVTGQDAISLRAIPAEGRTLLAEYNPPPNYVRIMLGLFPGTAERVFDPFKLSITTVRECTTRSGARKYIGYRWLGAPDEEVLREELFDLVADPGETRDLLAQPGDGSARKEVQRLREFIR